MPLRRSLGENIQHIMAATGGGGNMTIFCNVRHEMLQVEGMTMNASIDTTEKRLTIDLTRQEIRHGESERHKLSRLESALLTCLLGQAGRPLTRGELLAAVWRLDPLRTVTRTVDMHISMLRKKLRENSRKPALLVTVHGVGYMMLPSAQAL